MLELHIYILSRSQVINPRGDGTWRPETRVWIHEEAAYVLIENTDNVLKNTMINGW
jgi:hypothetical protein